MAHDEQYMDLAQTSLVSRVCRVDKALIVSTTQARSEERPPNMRVHLPVEPDRADQQLPGITSGDSAHKPCIPPVAYRELIARKHIHT